MKFNLIKTTSKVASVCIESRKLCSVTTLIMNTRKAPSADDIRKAESHLRSISLPITPVLTSSILNTSTGRNIYLKCENFQRTGSFKSRGAVNAVLTAIKKDPNIKGFVTHSSGNHGQALSYAASIVNRPCVVVVPQGTPKNKTDAIEHYGAELVICEPTPTSRTATCSAISDERDFMIIPPFDHPDVIAGQGTIAVELLEQVPNLDAILVPVSGGGLISGIALYAKSINPKIRIFACVPEGKMLQECLAEEKRLWPQPPQFLNTKCEACRLQQCGTLTFPVMCSLVDKKVFNISDKTMIEATRFAFERLKLVVELAAGLSLGAALYQSDQLDSSIRNVGIILCGGNIDLSAPVPWQQEGLRSHRSVLYVWSGQDASLANASDFVAVIDFDEKSYTYGSILRVVPLISDPSNGIGQAKNEPHHSSISSNGKYYITGGLLSFLQKQKEIFVWKIPRNPKHGPTFVCGIDAPGACTDEFQPIGNSRFIVSMMCDESAGSPGDMVIVDADTCTARSLLNDPIPDFNPHGYGRLNNGSMFVADYILPITLTGSDPSKIVFRNTCRHILPDGNLEQTFNFHFPTEPGTTTGLGHGIGFMELKTIPNDILGRAFACGTNTNTLYLIGPDMADPLPVLDVSEVNGYVKSPSSGIVSIFPSGKLMVMTFQMRFVILLDISDPVNPVYLHVFDFCTDRAVYNMAIKIPGTNDTTTFPKFCANNKNNTGTHVIIHPQGENRFIVLNYFLKFGLAQFSGTRTVHAFKLNKDLTGFTYDHRFNPNFQFHTSYRHEDRKTFHSLLASPHHAQYLKL